MLRIKVRNLDKTEKVITRYLTVVLNCDIEVPADDVTIICPFDKSLSENADFIYLYIDDTLIFCGQIDEIINIRQKSGVITKLVARSMAAALLDNEAEPITYIYPAAEFIFDRHLKQFGIEIFEADETPFYGNLRIDKGMTHWQVFENFCKNRFGAYPRITGDGKALFKGYEDTEVVVFGDESCKYYSVKEYNKRCELITEVRLKLDEFGSYNGKIKNENIDCNGVTRVRYVNATADTSTIETADKIIARSNSDSYNIELKCVGCCVGIIGRKAKLNDGLLGVKENLVVKRVKYILDDSGETSTITLRKEKF